MSFATIGRLERLRDFREAELFYNSVTPIRGRADDVRPLGARRDADKYKIVKCGNEDKGIEYHAVLYNTGCVRFLPNGEVVIATGGYSTALTMSFIGEVLGISAGRQRGSNVFRISGQNYITKGKEELRIKHIGNGQFDIISENKHFQYVINRTAANNVRKRSAAFRGYLRGFVSLRTQEVTKWGNTHNYVCIPTSELAAMFGTKSKEWMGKTEHYLAYDSWQHLLDKKRQPAAFYKASRELEALVTSDNTEDYYKAALVLAAHAAGINYVRAGSEAMIHANPDGLAATLDESQFKLYAKDVLTMVEVKAGKVPNTHYDSWADTDESTNEYDLPSQALVIKG